VAALVIVAQQLGWSRVGHALVVVAVPVGRAVWLAVKVGWPALLAVVISLLLGIGSRKRLAGVATRVRQGMAGRRWLAIAGVVVGVAGLLAVVLVAAPPWFVHDRSLEGLKAQNEVRTTLLQGLGGVVLLVGAYFTYRQLRTTREGQITERYTRAIDQLGHAQLDVRLGGIYALERIARDSPADRPTIGEVLTAFVRSHAPWPPRLPGQYVATALIHQVPELQVRAPDVQACLTVLGRGGFAQLEGQGDRLDLHAVDLRHARLVGANLEGANLVGAHLERANLVGAHLEGAVLAEANLEGANLAGTHLEGAVLAGADLERAYLGGARLEETILSTANLERAYLAGAHLEGAILLAAHLERANLSDAHLERANLSSADLERAILDGARLEEAMADKHTSWPAGFDWRAAGVIVEGEDAAASPPQQA
jgi:Pentapeptide repeats (8 copies)